MPPQPRKAYGDFEARRQLEKAGLLQHFVQLQVSELAVTGIIVNISAFLATLRARNEWQEGSLHHLHADIGPNRADFRAHRGAFGKGSLQIVLDTNMGRCYADVDAFSPYEDVVGWLGHAGEVVKGWFS